MGQKLGKSYLVPSAEPFANLPRKSIAQLWQVFNDIADGFGISRDELEEICTDLKDELNVSRLAMIEKAASLFNVLDTDKNGLIDALEFSSSLAALSGMRPIEILEFILSSYDFDGTQMLSIDEVTLALKSAATGICKLCLVPAPREEVIEQLVSAVFVDISGQEKADTALIRISTLAEHFYIHPDLLTWYASFGEPAQKGLQIHELLQHEVDYEKENMVEVRSSFQQDAIEWRVKNPPLPEVKDSVNSTSQPWLLTAMSLVPSQYASAKLPKVSPDMSLELAWVYGYQSEKSRNNVRYSHLGEVVYHTGRYAITYSFDGHKQKIFTSHTEEILCLAMHPSGKMVATGESGDTPRVLVWSTDNHQILFADRGFLRSGVAHVAFSTDGVLLAAVGLDVYHSVAVYKWTDSEILFTSRVDKGKCLSCSFGHNHTLAIGGDSYLYFWSKSAEGYKRRRGNFSSYSPVQAITCLAPLHVTDNMVAGTVSGHLFLWVDRNCVKNVKAHQGSVNALYTSEHGVLSGGKDRRVRLWTHRLEPGATFDMSNFGLYPSIRSACLSSDGTSMLVGTKGSDIYEVSAIDGSDLRGGALTSTHYLGQLHGLAVHPSKHEFATVGDDKHLRLWDMNTRSLLKVTTFDAEIRAVTYSPLGDVVAVGLGGESSSVKCGAFVIINEEDLSVVHEARDSASPVTLIVYSPDGDTLAVAAEDGSIYLYAVQDEYELIGRCIRHTKPVSHIDFSVEGEWIRSNSLGKDICFFNADDASFQSNTASMKDVTWISCTCIYSWHVKACHRTNYQGETPTSVHTPSSDGPKVLACGTSYGYVRIQAYPCPLDDSDFHRFQAHVNATSCVRFSFDNQRLLTIGLKDRCILQWKCVPFSADTELLPFNEQESEDFGLEIRVGDELKEDFMPAASGCVSGLLTGSQGAVSVLSNTSASPSLDTWLQSVVSPNLPPPRNTSVPDISVKLSHVYGYRCQDMRNNVRYTNAGEIVFPCATVGVVMNRITRAQNFFQGHSEAISAFATSYDGKYVATGQHGLEASVAIWSSETRMLEATLPDIQVISITALAFSNNCRLLAVIGLDEDHTVTVYDWRRRLVVGRAYTGRSHILHTCFSDNDAELMTCGVKTLKLWNTTTSTMTSTRPTLSDGGRLQPFLCGVYFMNHVVVGTAEGSLYVFINNAFHHAVKGHERGIHAIHVSPKKDQLVTGGKDGIVRLWNSDIECIKEIMVEASIQSINSRIRSVAFSMDATHILVGTRGAEIFEILLRNSTVTGGKPLVNGHGSRQLWGLTSHPTKEEFVTVGDDCTIRIWDAKTCTLIRSIKVDTPARAVTYSPDGKYIAIGFGCSSIKKLRTKTELKKEGAFTVLSAIDFKTVHEGKDSNEPIRVIKFSADSKLLAVGSEDSRICIYNVKDHFTKRCVASCHKAPVMNIDFAQGGQYIMSVDSSLRICYSETTSGSYISSAASMRDEKWSTWSTPVGWPTMGLWMCQPEGAEPTAVQRSWGGMMLGCGNSAGRVTIVYNPCPERAGFVGEMAHAGRISQIVWIAGDGMLLTTGANDNIVMQWKCMYDNGRESGDEGGLSCDDSEVERDGGNEPRAALTTRKSTGMAQPWMSSVVPPSNVDDDIQTTPNVVVDTDFVHGLRIADSRQAIRFNEDGNLVFVASTLGIIFDRSTMSQQIYEGHRAQLISIDVDSSGKLAVTGEKADNPELHVWDARTATKLFSIRDIHRRGIPSVSFSESSNIIATLGQDPLNSIVLLHSPSKRWYDACIHASISLSPAKMLWIKVVEKNEYPFIVGGNHIMFFLKRSGRTLEKSKGVFGRRRKLQPILSVMVGDVVMDGSSERKIYTGTVSGHVYIWRGVAVESTITAHDSPIFAMAKYHNGYATASKDGTIKLWDSEFLPVHSYDTQSFSPLPYGAAVHSLQVNFLSTKLVVGMKSGEVFEISLRTKSISLVLEGHSYKELHGLDPNPKNADEYATVGDDGVVRVWSVNAKVCLRRVSLDTAGRAISWSMDSNRLAIGVGGDGTSNKDGAVIVLNSKSLDVIYEDRRSKLWIADIRFSPEDTFLAVASRDGRVYLHQGTTYALLKVLDTPSKECAITRIDFSIDSAVLRVCTTTDELFHYTTSDGSLVASGMTVRDVDWCTNTSHFGWMIKGVWRPPSEEMNTISVDVNNRNDLVAASYQNGNIRIMNYPCQVFGGAFIELPCVSTACYRLRFSCDGKTLIVLDTYTRVIIQYKIYY